MLFISFEKWFFFLCINVLLEIMVGVLKRWKSLGCEEDFIENIEYINFLYCILMSINKKIFMSFF